MRPTNKASVTGPMHASNQLRRIHVPRCTRKQQALSPCIACSPFIFAQQRRLRPMDIIANKSMSNELRWTQTRETEQNQVQNRHAELLTDGSYIYNYICGGGGDDDIYIYTTNTCIQQTGPSSNNT